MEHEKISYVVIVYGVAVETKCLDSMPYCYYVSVDANDMMICGAHTKENIKLQVYERLKVRMKA